MRTLAYTSAAFSTLRVYAMWPENKLVAVAIGLLQFVIASLSVVRSCFRLGHECGSYLVILPTCWSLVLADDAHFPALQNNRSLPSRSC